jgi:hypothetical protein
MIDDLSDAHARVSPKLGLSGRILREQGFLSPSSDYRSKPHCPPQARADSPEQTLQVL